MAQKKKEAENSQWSFSYNGGSIIKGKTNIRFLCKVLGHRELPEQLQCTLTYKSLNSTAEVNTILPKDVASFGIWTGAVPVLKTGCWTQNWKAVSPLLHKELLLCLFPVQWSLTHELENQLSLLLSWIHLLSWRLLNLTRFLTGLNI